MAQSVKSHVTDKSDKTNKTAKSNTRTDVVEGDEDAFGPLLIGQLEVGA